MTDAAIGRSLDDLRLGDELRWEPVRLVHPGSWVGHIPFAFWLVKVLRPDLVVELGTHSGNSFSAFCQAIEAGGVPGHAHAVDSWQGDEQAGFYGAEVYEEFRAFNARRHAAVSTLHRADFDEARPRFDGRRIDILHIDGLHTYEAVRHDFEQWRDLVSDRGVVLFHDTSVYEKGFGVWKFWREVSASHPSFEFLHSNGLGVLGLGEAVPAELKRLFALASDPMLSDEVRRRFSSRSDELRERADASHATTPAPERAAPVPAPAPGEDAEPFEGAGSDEVVHLRRQLSELRKAQELRDLRIRELHGEAEREREAARRHQSAERSISERFAKLDRDLRETREEARSRLAAFEALRDESDGVHDLYLRSTSWRLTAPLRRAVDLAKRAKRLGRRLPPPPPPADLKSWRDLVGEPRTDARAITRTFTSERLRGFLRSGARLALPSHDEPDVSIVLVLYNQAELTYSCLVSIVESLAGSATKAEVVILDNGSTDSTAQLLDRLDGARIVRSPRNLHFLRGVNRAADEARGRHILLLNNDAQLVPGSVETAVGILDADSGVGAVGGRIVLPDGTLQEAGSIVWNDGTCVGYARGAAADGSEGMFRRDVDYCSGAFLLTPRALFERLGRFDEAFAPAYYEETDYCVRLREAGYRIVFDPAISIVHYEFGSSARSEEALALQRRNHEVFRLRHREWLKGQPAAGGNPHAARLARSPAKRILFVEDRVPKPQIGAGYPRANDIIHSLRRQGAEITIFPMFRHVEEWADVRRSIHEDIEVVLEGEATMLRAFLAERRGCYDAIFVSRPHNMAVLRDILDREPDLQGEALLVYDAEAVFSHRAVLMARTLGKPLTDEEAARLLRDEIALVRGSDLVLSVSAQEARLFGEAGIADVRLLGHAVEVDPTPAPFEDRPDLLFLGAIHADDSPNADSVLWFAREILPLIRRELGPSLRLKIVGMVDAPAVRALDGTDLQLLGRLDDVRPAFETARIVVVPTRYAAGIPHKAHHAASLGVPIVATDLIAGQLGWRNGRDLLSSSDPATFAKACVELYRNKALWGELRASALERVREECSAPAFDAAVAGILGQIEPKVAARLTEGKPEAPRFNQRDPEFDASVRLPLGFDLAVAPSPASVAAAVHLFYPEQAAEFRRYLENLPAGSGVYVSTDTPEKKARIEAAFANHPFGHFEVRLVPNRGRDIAPKLVGLRDVHERHEFVLHLHSKASHHDAKLAVWRIYLLESLLGTPVIARDHLAVMTRFPQVGMMFPQHLDHVRRWVDWGPNYAVAQDLAARLGVELTPWRAIDFPSGSMFWARSAALKPLLDLGLAFEDFAEEGGQKDATIAHAVERLYAVVCERSGHRWMKTARPELLADRRGITRVNDERELEAFVQSDLVRILGDDPMPVLRELYDPADEIPPALLRAADRTEA